MPQAINQVCSVDFMHVQLEDNRTFRLFYVIDNFNSEAIDMEVNFSLPSVRSSHRSSLGGASTKLFVVTTGLIHQCRDSGVGASLENQA